MPGLYGGPATNVCHSVGEFMTLFSKTVAERTRPGQRQDVEEQGMQALFTNVLSINN